MKATKIRVDEDIWGKPYRNTECPTWNTDSRTAQSSSGQPPSKRRIITPDGSIISLKSTPEPEPSTLRDEPPSQDTEENVLRRYFRSYDDIARQLEEAKPIVEQLENLEERLREYNDLQAEHRKLASIAAEAKATQLAAINNLSIFPGLEKIQERAIRRWENVFRQRFPDSHEPDSDELLARLNALAGNTTHPEGTRQELVAEEVAPQQESAQQEMAAQQEIVAQSEDAVGESPEADHTQSASGSELSVL